MRKPVQVAATASALALVLAACSGGDGQDEDAGAADGPVTLDYWAWGTAQKPMVDAWNATHPDIQVKHTDAGGGTDSSAKLVTATRAENAPDVAIVEYNTLPAMIVAGVAADISEHADGLESEFAPGVWNQVTFDGATYGVPQDAGPQALTYNKARFDELGIDVPTTWDDFAAAAEKVHEADPDAYLTTYAPAEFGGFAGYAQQAGAEWWTVDGDAWTVDFDDDASVAVADYWQDLVDRDLVLAEPMLTPEWNAKVNKGEVLSWPAGLWAAGVLYGVAEESAGDWAMAPLPQWTEGEDAVGFQGGSAVVVTSSAEHPEAAAEFARWMSTSDEAAAAQIEQGQYPASLAGQELTLESDPPLLMPKQEDYWEIAAEITKNTIPEISWGPNVNVASSAFQDAMSKAVTDGTPLRDALTATEDVVVADMEKTGFEVTQK
ncbi:ABC transporter substrate-binding protein [Isoptericola cucumis]|uniref:Sugar ABC transporter substrate-binding protein n=1 Tax=Isoptericola cucumis TaxID=1776856 RepID=A0ABQ2B5Z4_9MICO|nr:extracellular solute-binding protein [Isoptericola cucumis]GGI08860.1 sugar ABC transporter substrate-binding protein [Isoptericola cucumis]